MRKDGPVLQEIEIRYDSVCACEKEAIKEFFRFIGCLVYEKTIDPKQGLVDILRIPQGKSAQIILRSEERENTDLEVLKKAVSQENQICIFCDLTKKILSAWPRKNQSAKVNQGDYAKNLVDVIIDRVWRKNELQCIEVQQIHDIYCAQDLLAFLQCKRAFRVLKMNEILDMDGEIEDLPGDPFIWNMIKAFQTTAHILKQNSINSRSVYPLYAYVNVERKVRELARQMPNGQVVENVASAASLLAQLDQLDETDDSGETFSLYSGRYFLAAFICLTDDELELQANEYYRLALQSANPELVEKIFSARPITEEDLGGKSYFVAFIFYQIGMYNEKILKNLDAANLYYQCAIKCNENCYQALFKKACDKAKRNLFQEAILLFEKIAEILSKGLDLDDEKDWKYLSMKEWQYIYKINIWRAKIEWKCRGEAYTWHYLQEAGRAVEAYKENGCLMELISSSEAMRDELIKYHRDSAPVRKLEELLTRWIKISGMREQ